MSETVEETGAALFRSLVDPIDKSPLTFTGFTRTGTFYLENSPSGRKYPVVDGIAQLLPDQAIAM